MHVVDVAQEVGFLEADDVVVLVGPHPVAPPAGRMANTTRASTSRSELTTVTVLAAPLPSTTVPSGAAATTVNGSSGEHPALRAHSMALQTRVAATVSLSLASAATRRASASRAAPSNPSHTV